MLRKYRILDSSRAASSGEFKFKFFKDEDGVTSVEYAVMAALIALVVIAGATLLGKNTNDTFNTVAGVIPGGGS
jgi:pilus assembly protein Flp/PilA